MGLLKFAVLLIDFSCVFSVGLASPTHESRNGFVREFSYAIVALLVCRKRMHSLLSIQFEHDEPVVITLPSFFRLHPTLLSLRIFTRNH